MSGNLILSGRVSSFYEKHLAQELVRHVEGVHKVVNEVVVD
jgi:osmotically-inducible protein OsmY